MDEFEPDPKDSIVHKVYIDFQFEDWPLLSTLNDESQERLCSEISNSLEAVECKVQGIKARSEVLQLVLKVDIDVSIDDVVEIVAAAGKTVSPDPNAEQGPDFYSAATVSPWSVSDAVLRLCEQPTLLSCLPQSGDEIC